MEQQDQPTKKDKALYELALSKELFTFVYHGNVEKGFHPFGEDEVLKKQKMLMLVVTEVAEAVEALRINKQANWNRFNNQEEDTAFYINFQDNIKDTFADELADVCIRLYDFAGCFNIPVRGIRRNYESEMEAWKEIDIRDTTAFLFSLTRNICDVYYGAISGELVGECLGKIHSLAIHCNIDLQKHIEAKMKYNSMRPAMHGKEF